MSLSQSESDCAARLGGKSSSLTVQGLEFICLEDTNSVAQHVVTDVAHVHVYAGTHIRVGHREVVARHFNTQLGSA